jgi:regulator of CtrA degradation
MHPAAQQATEPQQLLFLPSVFNETIDLLFDAHHYFQSRGIEEQASIPEHYRLLFSHEMSRITDRLTNIMAWVMVRKAVSAGEIDDEIAGKNYRLDADNEAHTDIDAMLETLPYYIGYLSERTKQLYSRVERLDRMAYETHH